MVRDISAGQGAPVSGAKVRDNDTLTGLTVRDLFMRHFEVSIADAKIRERGIAVMCIDIDRFSRINETLGLQASVEGLQTNPYSLTVKATGFTLNEPDGGELLLPVIDDVILEIDAEANRAVVRLLPGL